MFGKRFRLFKLLGFQVQLDVSWLIIAVLVTWTLAVGVFPTVSPGSRRPRTGSWVPWAHEDCLRRLCSMSLRTRWCATVRDRDERNHVVRVRRRGRDERRATQPEGGVLYGNRRTLIKRRAGCRIPGLAQWGQARGWPPQVYGVLGYLGWINAILVVFNLVPAFPLDGGRVARSIIWNWNKNFRAATRIVTAIGSGFGLLLMGLGILGFVLGNFIGGIGGS